VQISVANSTKKAPPVTGRRLACIAKICLPSNYDLSVTYVGRTAARRLNRELRRKDYATNILSFSYGARDGELVLNLDRLARDQRELGFRTRTDAATYLLVHGALHLAGLPHGRKMDAREEAALLRLGVRRTID